MEDKSELDQSATSTECASAIGCVVCVCVCVWRHNQVKKWADRTDAILYTNQLGITSAYAVIASHGEGENIYRAILPTI